MGPLNGMNPNKINYFSIEEYIAKIKLEDNLLEHLEETNREFDNYLKILSKYDDYAIIYYWIDSLAKEVKYSQELEKHTSKALEIVGSNVFFDSLQISHKRIKELHQFVTSDKEMEDYRVVEVRVSKMTQTGEQIYWYGVEPEDVKKFMNDFIRVYKSNSLSFLNANPFLKSALMHLLFVRIHPFIDGNGRTARMIHNLKFTESINKIYGTKLKICPLNLSHSILINQPTYAKRLNDIYFDLEHDNNEEINKWFDFILNMIDEQLYFSVARIPSLERSFNTISKMKRSDTPDFVKEIEKMEVKQKILVKHN